MESMNTLKGYAKVNSNLEIQTSSHSQNHRRRLFITLSITAVLLLTLVIGLMLAALIYESTTESPEEESAESIQTVCAVTRYPASCVTSISSLNPLIKPDPEVVFNLSLQVSVNELKNVSSRFRSLNDVKFQAAVDDCLSQFDDALSKLDDSLRLMEVGPQEKALTSKKINDIQTWISAAMTYQQSCLDGLEEMGSTLPDEIKGQLENSKELLSNSLAIVANMHRLLEDFDLKMH